MAEVFDKLNEAMGRIKRSGGNVKYNLSQIKRLLRQGWAISAMALLLTLGATQAADLGVGFTVGKPEHNGQFTIKRWINPNNKGQPDKTFTTNITANMSAAQKRDAITTVLKDAGWDVGTDGNTLTIKDENAKNGKWEFNPGETAEGKDKISILNGAAVAAWGGFGFGNNVFALTDPLGQPSLFYAGFVTPSGVFETSISAADPGFQADGPAICQSLYAALVAQAPAYGVELSFLDNSVEARFAPGKELGVIFGTTAATDGAYGWMAVPEPSSLTLIVGALLLFGALRWQRRGE